MTLISIYIRTLKYSNSRIRDERMISLAYGYATLPVQQLGCLRAATTHVDFKKNVLVRFPFYTCMRTSCQVKSIRTGERSDPNVLHPRLWSRGAITVILGLGHGRNLSALSYQYAPPCIIFDISSPNFDISPKKWIWQRITQIQKKNTVNVLM